MFWLVVACLLWLRSLGLGLAAPVGRSLVGSGCSIVTSAVPLGQSAPGVSRWNGSFTSASRTASSSISDAVGASLSLTPDGRALVVGAPLSDVATKVDQGLLILLYRVGTTPAYMETQGFGRNDGLANDQMGRSVIIVGNGTIIMSGIPGDDTGALNKGSVRLYAPPAPGHTYVQVAMIQASDGTVNSTFGASMAVDTTGAILAVGAPGMASKNGAVYIFSRVGAPNTAAYLQAAKLSNPEPEPSANFGGAVALTGDAGILAVGAGYTSGVVGRVLLFTRSGSSYTYATTLFVPGATPSSRVAAGISLDANGTRLLVSMTDATSASVQVFARGFSGSATDWTYVGNIVVPEAAMKDVIPALYADGRSVLIGVQGAGVVKSFSLPPCWDFAVPAASMTCAPVDSSATAGRAAPGVSQWSDAVIAVSGLLPADGFGASVSLSLDEGLLVVGAPSANLVSPAVTAGGKVFVLTRQGGAGSTSYGVVASPFSTTDATFNAQVGTATSALGNGSVLLIGSERYSGAAGAEQGSLRVFLRQGSPGDWTYTQASMLLHSDAAAGDRFGSSVARDATGAVIAVGAMLARGSGVRRAGAVYIFRRGGGIGTASYTQAAKVNNPAPESDAQFGRAVAIRADSLVLAVAAPYNTTTTTVGRVFLFSRSSTSANFTYAATLFVPGSTSSSRVGVSLSFDFNGTRLLVGAEETTSGPGAVHVFSRTSHPTGFTYVGAISLPSAGVGSRFSFGSLFSDGRTALLGHRGGNAVYGFSLPACWNLTASAGPATCRTVVAATRPTVLAPGVQQLTGSLSVRADVATSSFGAAVAIVAGGRLLVVGAPQHAAWGKPQWGSVIVYARDPLAGPHPYTLVNNFTALDGQGGMRFGTSIAARSDGSLLFVGSPGESSQLGGVRTFSGRTVLGAPFTSLAKLTSPVGMTGGALFGSALSCTSDSSVLAVGAPGTTEQGVALAGRVFLYRPTQPNGTIFAEAGSIANPAPEMGALFGTSVQLSPDASLLFVGATYSNTGVGRVYVLARQGAAGSNLYARAATLSVPSAVPLSSIGSHLALASSGSVLLVGATDNAASAPKQGAVFVFVRSGAPWEFTFVGNISLAGGQAGDAFGAVSTNDDGTLAIVGAEGRAFSRGVVQEFSLPACWAPVTAPVTCVNTTAALHATQVAPNVTLLGGSAMVAWNSSDACSGSSIAVQSDGAFMAVGDRCSAAGNGTVMLYSRNGGLLPGSYNFIAELAGIGEAVGLSATGDVLLVGAPRAGTFAGAEAGSVFALQRVGVAGSAEFGQPTVLVANDSAAGELLGSSVACSPDAALVFAGAPSASASGQAAAGSVVIWSLQRSSDVFLSRQINRLNHPQPTAGDRFGQALAFTADTSLLAVGAPGGTQGLGSVFVFLQQGGNCVLRWTLRPAASGSSGVFGGSLAILGSVLLVGDERADTDGRVRVFGSANSSMPWQLREVGSFFPSPPVGAARFGASVGLFSSGSLATAVVAASGMYQVLSYSLPFCWSVAAPAPTVSPSPTALPTLSTSATQTALPFLSATAIPSPSTSADSSWSSSATVSSQPSADPSASSYPSASAQPMRTASATSSLSPFPSSSATARASWSAAPSRIVTDSPTASSSMSVSPSGSPSTSSSASPSHLPMPRLSTATANVVQPATCDRVAGCISLPVRLRLRGASLLPLCVRGSGVPFLSHWTSAPFLSMESCSEDEMTLLVDAVNATSAFLWRGTQITAELEPHGVISLGPLTPAMPPLAAANASEAVWSDRVQLLGTGIGDLGVAVVKVGPAAAGGTAPSPEDQLPCADLERVDADTLACSLRFLRSSWEGRSLAFLLTLESGWQSPFPSHVGVQMLPAPSLPLLGPLTPLSRSGGSQLAFTLPYPAWAASESSPLGLGSDVVLVVGRLRSQACNVTDPARRIVSCIAPAGAGEQLRSALLMGGTLVLSGPAVHYQAPAIVSVQPRVLLLRLSNQSLAEVQLTLDAAQGVTQLRNLTITTLPCRIQRLSSNNTLTCVLGSEAAVEAAMGERDSADLSASFVWGDATVSSGSLGVLMVRPTVSQVVPTRVNPGGVLIVFGSGFCPSSSCDDKATAGVTINIGDMACLDVLLVSPSAATCTVPSVVGDEPTFPVFAVTVRNAVGAVARGSFSVEFPASGFVRALSALPRSFIPSDPAVPWLVPEPITVAIFAPQSRAPFAGTVDCSLVALTPAVSVSAMPIRNASGIADFGRLAITAPVTLSSVTLSVSCTTPDGAQGGNVLPLVWSLALTPLHVVMCGKPPTLTQSQARLPPLVLKLLPGEPRNVEEACAAQAPWRGPALPPITCAVTFSSPSGDATLQNSAILMETVNASAVLDRLALNGEVDREFSLFASCSIGNLRLLPIHPWKTRVTGCSVGTEPQGVLCRPCQPGYYSDGGVAPCTTCPRFMSCPGGVLTLPSGLYRPPADAGLPLDGSSELHPCIFSDGCFVNTSSRTFGCNEGYSGPLCGVCDVDGGFGKFGDACWPCFNDHINRVVVAGACLFSVFFLVALVFRKFNVAAQRRDEKKVVASTGWRLLLGYYQALSSLRGFRASGGAFFKRAIGFVAIFSPAAVSEGPMQCLAKPSHAVVFSATVLLPIIAVFASLLLVAAADAFQATRAHCCTRTTSASWLQRFRALSHASVEQGRHIFSMVVVGHLCYMPVVSLAINSFRCTDPIGGTRYLQVDLREACAGSGYAALALASAIILAAFGIGFPLFVFRKLYRLDASTLAYGPFVRAWGFLFAGLRTGQDADLRVAVAKAQPAAPAAGEASSGGAAAAPSSWMLFCGRLFVPSPRLPVRMAHYEAIVLLRKAMIVVIEATLAEDSAQSLVFILAMVGFLFILIFYWPYSLPAHNWAEAAGLLAVIATATLNLLVRPGEMESDVRSVGITAFLLLINLLTAAGLSLITAFPIFRARGGSLCRKAAVTMRLSRIALRSRAAMKDWEAASGKGPEKRGMRFVANPIAASGEPAPGAAVVVR